jgi:hypothetical protein
MTSKHQVIAKEGLVKKTFSSLTTVVGVATLFLAGYALLKSIPDLKRYIKISTM